MSRIKPSLISSLVILALLLNTLPAAANGVTFTVASKSAFLRAAPYVGAPTSGSVFKGQTFSVTGRLADNSWVRLDFAGAAQETWILAALGALSGDLNGVPVIAVTVPAASPVPASQTAGEPQVLQLIFTVTVKSAYARSAPTLSSTRIQSIFKGQTFIARARSADNQWLRIDITGAATETWVLLAYGQVNGYLTSLPVSGAPAAPASPTPAGPAAPAPADIDGPTQPVVPVVSAHAREIYQRGLTLGNNPRHFSKVGDCQNVVPFFLASFDNPADYKLGPTYAYLQDTIRQFSGSFARKSEAVRGGFNVTSVFDPQWSNPKQCQSGETPIECEFRLYRPSIVIISMETWWSGKPATEYEAGLRRIVEFAIEHGAVPIVATKADNLEKDGSLNAAVVRVAQAYDIPLWNFWAATRPLPNYGLIDDGFHLTWGRSFFDDPAALQRAWPWRNLTALQTLDAVWKAVR